MDFVCSTEFTGGIVNIINAKCLPLFFHIMNININTLFLVFFLFIVRLPRK